MKYIIVVGDGMADWPIPELNNKTILEVAEIPNMDFLAQHGKVGLLKTIPDSMAPGSEVANTSIMGYRPETDLTGRGALEALSAGVTLAPNEIAFRCNLITIKDGLIEDYSSGHITTPEGKQLIERINMFFKETGVDFFPGVQYRHILRLSEERFSQEIICTPPHDQLGKPYKQFIIQPKNLKDQKAVATTEFLNTLIEKSNKILMEHPVNQQRKAAGKNCATHVWFWGSGKRPAFIPFSEKYGLNGSVISAVDLIFGIGIAAGLNRIDVPGATGLPDTNYLGKANAALDALKEKDFVYVHIEAPDEMGHAADIKKKKSSIEDIDKIVIATILKAKDRFPEGLTLAVLPDHPTPCQIRTHARDPVPFVFYTMYPESKKKAQKKTTLQRENPSNVLRFTEAEAKKGELGLLLNGEEFMRLFLRQK